VFQLRNLITLSACALATASLLTACGGGSSSTPQLTDQAALTASAASTSLATSATTTLSSLGGSGTGAVTYAVASGSCTISGTTLTAASSAGTCTVTATKAADSTYAAKTSTALSIPVTAAPAVLNFSTGFAAGALTIEAGKFGGYSGSNLDNWNCGAPASCGSGADLNPTVTAANSRFYYYYSVPSATTGQYTGIFVQAPGVTTLSTTANTAGVTVTNQTSIGFTVGANPEFFGNANHNIAVLLTLGKYYSVNNGACNLKLLKVMPLSSAADTAYTAALSSFTVTQDCGTGITTAAAALAVSPISQVDFQANSGGSVLTQGGLSTGANSTTVDQYGGRPTTLAVKGGITFQ